MQILCVVSQKKLQLLGDETPYRARWGTSVPQIPILLLCPPNNPVRSTLLVLFYAPPEKRRLASNYVPRSQTTVTGFTTNLLTWMVLFWVDR